MHWAVQYGNGQEWRPGKTKIEEKYLMISLFLGIIFFGEKRS
jgi:hypothetical protein